MGPEVHETVAEAVGDRVDADVGEDPVGRDAARDAQGVVEAVATGPVTERLRDPERHVVADDRERGRGHLEDARQPDPERAAAVARGAVELVEAAGGAIRISMRSMIVPSCRSRISRGGQSSGGGTSGRTAHSP